MQTVPWPHTSPADAARPVTARRIKLASFSLSLICFVALAVALAALVPLLAGTELSEGARNRLLIVLFPAALGIGALCALVLVQWRARRLAAETLRSTARELQRGAWRTAVHRMREQPPAEPSAFGDLANQVEGVMGESERRWQARVELSLEWYWETDERHRLSSLSADAPLVKPADRALGDLLGRRHDELGFVHPPSGGWAAFNLMLDRQESFNELELEVDGLGGRARGWMALTGRARTHRDGHFAGYEGVGRDITAHKESYRRLQSSEQRYAVLAGLSADWYWATDTEHRFVDDDGALQRRFGTLAEAIRGRTRWEVYADALPEAQWRAHRADLEAGRAFQGLEFLVRRPDGMQLWVSIAGAPRYDEGGRFVGYHGVGRDITHAQEGRAVADAAQPPAAIGRGRTHQGARVRQPRSRGLRAPPRARVAHADRARAGSGRTAAPTPGRTVEARARRTARSADPRCAGHDHHAGGAARAGALVERGHRAQRARPEPAGRRGDRQPAAVERVAPVRWEIEPGLTVWASESQMRIVLANLLGNAAKFTRRVPDPVVSLGSVLGAGGQLVYQVRDNGAGFDASRASMLFQPFRRLHGNEEFQGTGIGLTIVQRIVQRHGGNIRAMGEVGQGACFEFSLGQREAGSTVNAPSLPDVSQPQPLDSTQAPPRELAA